ncbi:MAG: WGR domain-containing protein [Candidatus Nanoarchaeia archaeon]|jgi:poly [ADP-ribose] polymerase|nr:WGR domain-containing protein [Candidatus Nanoarchaeia archaeon]
MAEKLLKSRKVSGPENDGFTETVKHKVLFCGNPEGNNNKFYSIELQKNSKGQYRLFTHYGRLGKTDVYEVRDEYLGRPLDLSTADREFEVILASKLKGKKKESELGGNRVEKYELVETFAPTVGSVNVRGKNVGITVSVKKDDVVDSYSNPEVARIIRQIVDENIHTISTLTTLKLTSNGFETPLGPVTKEHVANARVPLMSLKSLMVNDEINPDNQLTRDHNAKYFSMIPHPFGHKITKDDWILSAAKLAEEFELLDNLESAVTMGAAMQNAAQQKRALGTDIEIVSDKREIDRIYSYITTTKAGNHRGSDVWNWKPKNVFKIKIPAERARFEKTEKQFGNQHELFHGSKNGNILSILKGGLIIPSCNAGHVTGRMFGDGIYFANASTKSLNYSTGFWGGRGNKNSNSFLFLANVAMGKTFVAHDARYSGIPHGYDSIHAQKGRSLYNDEFIVFKLQQATLTYLVEMTK